MQFHHPAADFFVPDATAPAEALQRTTHLCIAAHQDDIEIMAYHVSLAQEVLRAEFPEIADHVRYHIPGEQEKRHGQAIAASLPALHPHEA